MITVGCEYRPSVVKFESRTIVVKFDAIFERLTCDARKRERGRGSRGKAPPTRVSMYIS